MSHLDQLIIQTRNNLNVLLRLKLERPELNENVTLTSIINHAQYLQALLQAKDSALNTRTSQ